MVGYKPQDGDNVAIVEDVVTSHHCRAGVHRAVQARGRCEYQGPVRLRGPDGAGHPGVLHPGRAAPGLRIQVFPIVTVREVISFLHNNPIDGKVYIDDEMKAKMEAYLEELRSEGLKTFLIRLEVWE